MIKITVNADDFGWSESCTKAICEAFDKGIIKTTTMINCGSYADKAYEIAKSSDLKDFIGIHFDLTEGTPMTDGIRHDPFFCGDDGLFHMRVNRYKKLTAEQKKHAYDELSAQAEKYCSYGLKIHHADSHHHIHTAPNLFPVFQEIWKEYGIQKVRISRNIGEISAIKKMAKAAFNSRLKRLGIDYTDYFGSPEECSALNKDKIKNAAVELMVHPDLTLDGALIDRSGEAPYDAPFGKDLAKILEEANDRGNSLV
ncbi:MAG: ChbG/HpnK family deacetylase [Clostridia bacterium]|nr:ChbG/HpnK family deacetylase [Clostridia bacterium]